MQEDIVIPAMPAAVQQRFLVDQLVARREMALRYFLAVGPVIDRLLSAEASAEVSAARAAARAENARIVSEALAVYAQEEGIHPNVFTETEVEGVERLARFIVHGEPEAGE